jgi:hypothetical protein
MSRSVCELLKVQAHGPPFARYGEAFLKVIIESKRGGPGALPTVKQHIVREYDG